MDVDVRHDAACLTHVDVRYVDGPLGPIINQPRHAFNPQQAHSHSIS